MCSILYPDIIYLNRQRIQAIQELNEMKTQQKALLQKIQHLEEAQTHASVQQRKYTPAIN